MRPIFTTSDSFESLRNCLRTHKTFVVRGAVDPKILAEFADRAAWAYMEHDGRGANDDLYRQGHIPATEIGTGALEGVGNSGYVKALQKEVFRWSNRLECPRDFLLRRILPTTARAVTPSIPFHQDEYFGLISAPKNPPRQLCFTMWLPLVACGADAPGLSVVVGSDSPIVMGAPRFGWKPYIIWKYGINALWSPKLEAGDLLVFTSRVIHGSYVRPSMTKPRYSIEMRGGIN